MDCKHTRKRASAWLDGELPEATAEAVDRHVRGCAACAAHVQELRRMAEVLDTWDAPPVPKSLAERIRRAAQDHPVPIVQLRTWRRHHWMGRIAATLLVAVGLAAGMLTAPSAAPAQRPDGARPTVAFVDAYDVLAEGMLTDMMMQTLEDPAIEGSLL